MLVPTGPTRLPIRSAPRPDPAPNCRTPTRRPDDPTTAPMGLPLMWLGWPSRATDTVAVVLCAVTGLLAALVALRFRHAKAGRGGQQDRLRSPNHRPPITTRKRNNDHT
jgi:hypothetical protein